MVRDGGVPGNRITSQFYDPFYYLPSGYNYSDHKDVAGPLLQCWLSNTQSRLLLMPPPGPFNASVADYQAFISDNPQWFTDTGAQLSDGFVIVGVHVPAISADECSRAARAAPA